MAKTLGTPKKDSTKPFLAARVPASLSKALEAHTKSTGESKTDTLINALAAYLGWSEEGKRSSSTSDRLSLLEERIKELEATIYKPRQTSLLEIEAPQNQATKKVIKEDNQSDNKKGDEEWLTTKEAYDKYGGKATYDAFRKTKPEKMRERFGLEADTSKKTPGQASAKWIRKLH